MYNVSICRPPSRLNALLNFECQLNSNSLYIELKLLNKNLAGTCHEFVSLLKYTVLCSVKLSFFFKLLVQYETRNSIQCLSHLILF